MQRNIENGIERPPRELTLFYCISRSLKRMPIIQHMDWNDSKKINLPIGQQKRVVCSLTHQSHRCKVNDNMRSSPSGWKVGFPSPNVRGSFSS